MWFEEVVDIWGGGSYRGGFGEEGLGYGTA